MYRKYNNNYSGISIAINKGTINISQNVMGNLGNPRAIIFEKYSDDWISLKATNDKEAGYEVNLLPSAHINNKILVDAICDSFRIYRHDSDTFAPFYKCEFITDKGVPIACIKMRNFNS